MSISWLNACNNLYRRRPHTWRRRQTINFIVGSTLEPSSIDGINIDTFASMFANKFFDFFSLTSVVIVLLEMWKKQDPKPNQPLKFLTKKKLNSLRKCTDTRKHHMHKIVNEIFSSIWTSIHWAIIMSLFLHSLAFNKIENKIMKFGYFDMTIFVVIIIFFWIISQPQMCQIMKC